MMDQHSYMHKKTPQKTPTPKKPKDPQPTNQNSHKYKLNITLHLMETIELQYRLQSFPEVWNITLFPSELPLSPKQVLCCETF